MPSVKIHKRPAAFCETLIDEELVIMSVDTGDFYALKGSSLAIWRLIDGESDLTAIETALLRRYSVEEARCHKEVGNFVNAMVGAGLVELG